MKVKASDVTFFSYFFHCFPPSWLLRASLQSSRSWRTCSGWRRRSQSHDPSPSPDGNKKRDTQKHSSEPEGAENLGTSVLLLLLLHFVPSVFICWPAPSSGRTETRWRAPQIYSPALVMREKERRRTDLHPATRGQHNPMGNREQHEEKVSGNIKIQTVYLPGFQIL